jgi:hypothetical protein
MENLQLMVKVYWRHSGDNLRAWCNLGVAVAVALFDQHTALLKLLPIPLSG